MERTRIGDFEHRAGKYAVCVISKHSYLLHPSFLLPSFIYLSQTEMKNKNPWGPTCDTSTHPPEYPELKRPPPHASEPESSHAAGGNTKWYNHLRKPQGKCKHMSPKTWTMLTAALVMTIQNWKQLSINRRMGQKSTLWCVHRWTLLLSNERQWPNTHNNVEE